WGAWQRSRVGTLRIASDAVEFLDWVTPCANIDITVLTFVRGITPTYFLRIRAKGKSYQFGAEGRCHFLGELPFPVRRESTEGFPWLRVLLILASLAIVFALLLWQRRR